MPLSPSIIRLGLSSVLGLTVIACSDDDGRPSVSDETSPPAESTPTEPASFEACRPGDRRECKHYWRDHLNIAHCVTSTQICAGSGTWLACGAAP